MLQELSNHKSENNLDPHIDSNTVCQVCFENFKTSDLASLSCKHLFCHKCWKRYIKVSVLDGLSSGELSRNCICPCIYICVVNDYTVMSVYFGYILFRLILLIFNLTYQYMIAAWCVNFNFSLWNFSRNSMHGKFVYVVVSRRFRATISIL